MNYKWNLAIDMTVYKYKKKMKIMMKISMKQKVKICFPNLVTAQKNVIIIINHKLINYIFNIR